MRALGLALAAVLALSAAVAAQAEAPAPWDEEDVIVVENAADPDVLSMSTEDFCRSMAYLLLLYQDDETPTEAQISRCSSVIDEQMSGQAWMPSPWAALLEAPAGPNSKPKTPPKPKRGYTTLGKRGWQLLMKSPDKYDGRKYRVWACIAQFDSATGDDGFRGQASFKKQRYWWTDGDNVVFVGDANQLANYVEDDIVVMSVTSLGSYSYDTQIGGSTTVPMFEVDSITRLKGSC